MSILELARMVTAPDNLEQLHKVAQLHALEREMMLGRLKRNALVRLAELTEEVPAASADEVRAAEVMRKACVDLLRYGESSSRNPAHQSPPPRDDVPEPINEEKILALLEQLGEEKYEDEPYEPRGSREPTGPPRRTSGAGVREVNITHDAQVGMAFGKTSDHGTGSDCTRKRRAPPLEAADTRTRTRRVPPASHRDSTSSDARSTPAEIPSTEDRQRKPHNEILLDEAHPP